MNVIIGDFLRNLDDEFKSKEVVEVIISKAKTVLIVYKFWNQVGNKERVNTLDNLLKNHKVEHSNKIN